jgi:outer membrane protein TolC
MRVHRLAWLAAVLCGPGLAAQAQDAPPLTLRAAVAEALDRSPLLAESDWTLRGAEVRRDAARSSFGMRLTPSLSSGFESLGLVQQNLGIGVAKRLATGAEVSADISSFRYDGTIGDQRDAVASVRVSQPLLSGFGRVARADLDRASRAVESARRGGAAARQQLILTVAEAFYAVVRHERGRDAAQQARDRAMTLQESAVARTAVGLATELDVMRARLLAGQAEATLAREIEALDAARDRLRHTIGRPLDAPLVIDVQALAADGRSAGVPAGPHEAPLDVEALVAHARAQRADVMDARAEVETARRTVEVTKWQVLPPLTLEVGYTRRSTWAGGPPTPLAQPDGGWHLAVVSGAGLGVGAARATVRAATLAAAAAERRARDVDDRVAIEVRAAARSVTRTGGAIRLSEDAVALARRQRELVDLRFQRGLATSLDVVEAESMLFQSETGAIAAQIDHALARLSLERTAGTLDPAAWSRP